ncbi:right-handed parallel beta-helix repeat-containing protein [Spirosoma sordidisoli]|nr:right-handed parallel beta-helix repeat-containing protein [Spirosoma sordidisoli]
MPSGTPDGGCVFPASGGGVWVRQFRGPARFEWWAPVAGDGADNTALLVSALTSVKSLNVPEGRFCFRQITIPRGCRIGGVAGKTTLVLHPGVVGQSSPNLEQPDQVTGWLNASQDSITIENLTLDLSLNTTPVSAIKSYSTSVNSLVIDHVNFKNGINPFVYHWTSAPFSGLQITFCKFLSGTNAISVRGTSKGRSDVLVDHNKFDDCGGNIIGLEDNLNINDLRFDVYFDCQVTNNTIVNCRAGAGAAGPIPIEYHGVTRGVVSGNTINTGTRGIGISTSQGIVVSKNVITNQSAYAFETSKIRGVSFLNNISTNNPKFIALTGADGGVAFVNRDVLIQGNQVTGTGLSSWNAADPPSAIQSTYNDVIENWTISNNKFVNLEFTESVIMLRGAHVTPGVKSAALSRKIFITNNQFISDSVMTPIQAIVVEGNQVYIEGNHFLRSADYTSATHYQSGGAVVSTTGYISRGPLDDVNINRNTFQFTGTRGSGAFSAVGQYLSFVGQSLCTNLSLRSNHIRGNYRYGIYTDEIDGKTFIDGNEIDAAVQTPYQLSPSVVLRQTLRSHDGTSAPTTGTWRLGDRVLNSNPAPGAVSGWVCITAGTPGVWADLSLAGYDYAGTGSPIGVIAAPVGAIYRDITAGTGRFFYKGSGVTGNTGWREMAQAVSPTLSGTVSFSHTDGIGVRFITAGQASGHWFQSSDPNETFLYTTDAAQTRFELKLGTARSNDATVGLRYITGTLGGGTGVLSIGQASKNLSGWTHGFTRLYNMGVITMTTTPTNRVLIGTQTDNGRDIAQLAGSLSTSAVYGAGAAPTVAAGAGAGTGPTVSIVGTATAGIITVVTGSAPGAGTLATLTFPTAYVTNAPIVVVSGAQGTSLPAFTTSESTTGFSVATTTAPSGSTTYRFSYITIGR